MRVAGFLKDSLIDGPGVRLVVFTQGCDINCPDCQNPETHDIKGGYEVSTADILDKLTVLTTGITVSGGEPTLQPYEVGQLLKHSKDLRLNTMVYTGRTKEEFIKTALWIEYADYIDYVKCGPYVAALRDTTIPYVGSSNQELYRVNTAYFLKELTKI